MFKIRRSGSKLPYEYYDYKRVYGYILNKGIKPIVNVIYVTLSNSESFLQIFCVSHTKNLLPQFFVVGTTNKFQCAG